MKKIVSAVAIAAMAAGFAAAEVKISANFRNGQDLLEHSKGRGTTLLNSNSTNRETSDSISLKGSADFGGMEIELTPTIDKATSAQSLKLAKYNGWINFGDFMFKVGTWDARAVGRVNPTIGNHEGKFWGEPYKPGLSNKGGTTGNGVDVSAQSAYAGSGKIMTSMLQYKKDALEVRAAYTNKEFAKTYSDAQDDKDDWQFANELWMVEAGYSIADFGRVMGTYKNSYKDNTFALFVEPNKVVDGLTSLVGFTYETSSKNDKDNNAMAIDLRAAFKVDDALTVTGMFNYTMGKNDDADVAAMWGMVNATYKLNDTFVPFCSVLYTTGTKCGEVSGLTSTDADTQSNLRIYPGVEIYNTKSANIITGVAFDVLNLTEANGGEMSYTVRIPMLMRVKF